MILYRHILRHHAAPFVYSLLLLVFICVMNYAIQILDQIISRGLDVGVVLEIFAINLGWMIALTLPMAILVSTLMAFGGMSADNEIVAIKASGFSLYHLLVPVLAGALILSVILAYFNDLILPDANHRTANLMSDVSRKRPAAFIEPNILIRDFDNYTLYVKEVEARSGKLRSIKIFSDIPGEDPSTTVADSGEINQTADGSHLRLVLHHGETHSLDSKDNRQYFLGRFDRQVLFIKNVDTDLRRTTSDYRGDREKSSQLLMEDLTRFRQSRRAVLDEYNSFLDEVTGAIRALDSAVALDSTPVTLPAPSSFGEWVAGLESDRARAIIGIKQAKNTSERIYRRLRAEDMKINQYLVEIHKKYSIPVACLVFVLIGAPLGIMARRGGIAVGATYSVFFFILYWAFLIQGEYLADRLIISPFAAMWSANILIGGCGLYLLVKMMRETTFFSYLPLFRALAGILGRIGRSPGGRALGFIIGLPLKILGFPLFIARLATGIVPMYLVRIFLGYVVGILVAILSVFLVVDYVSNSRTFFNVPFSQVARYYWYYLPWIIQLVIPPVLLLASMAAVGKLAKHSELTAIKSAGLNVKGLCSPLFLLGLGLAVLSFYLGEQILPQANMRRAELLEEIKGGRSAGTRDAPGHREFRRNFYYFGGSNSIYCFQEFMIMPQRTRNVWRETFENNRVVQRIQAEHSVFQNGEWFFINGSVRDFSSDSSFLAPFDTLRDSVLTVRPEEMVVRIKSPQEMSYWELSNYIDKTRRRGEKVQVYLADLQFKIAYPVMNFIVILLGISIAARAGRSGSAVLFGIGILLMLAYWIISRFLLTFGKNGQISPYLGAWLGNIVFLVLGLFLFRKADR